MVELIDQATASALIQAAGLAIIAGITKAADAKREKAKADTDAKRKAEAEWRAEIDRRMDEFERTLKEQNENIDLVLISQISQMRSDIVHKTHRYLDDLGCASTEEKNAYDAEYNEYCMLCKAADVENDFLDSLHAQVMALPGR